MPTARTSKNGALAAGDAVRQPAALAVLAGGLLTLGFVVHGHYPIHQWLFWRFASYWIVCGVWAFSCLSAGCFVLSWLGKGFLPALEFLVTAFAVGVLIFFLGMFWVGVIFGLSTGLALAWPVVTCLVGARPALRRLNRLRRPFRVSKAMAPGRWAMACFGGLGLALVYFSILAPDNIGFDARWYHLPIAEHYVAAGRIVPFAEGWYLGAYPHLASIVFTWAFLLPFTTLFDRVLLAAHLEFVFFVATLASVPILVRRLVGPPFRWESFAAVFLFPCVLVYDSALCGGADHVLAFFAIPVYLSLRRLVKNPDGRHLVVTALLLAGALLTKYQAVYLLAAAVWAAGFALIARFARSPRGARTYAMGGGWTLLLGLALTAPHWLFNWAWYGDPLYPMLHAHLPGHPFGPAAARHLSTFYGIDYSIAEGSWSDQLAEAARAAVSFSFEPHDWATYHGSVPVFGSLFTILSFLVPLLRFGRRVAPLVGATLLGIAIWFLSSHQDRYLQCLLPWMASATFALALLVHRDWPRLRGPLWLLIGLQVVWGGDAYFIPAKDTSYEVDRLPAMQASAALLSSGYRGDLTHRLHPFPPWESIGNALPADAKVLLHERYLHLGLGRMSVTDLPGWQGGISYAELLDSQAIDEKLRSFGVTHVAWETTISHELDSIAGDLAFYRFVTQWVGEARPVGSFTVARLGTRAPPKEDDGVAWYDCPAGEGDLFRLRDLDVPELGPAERARIRRASLLALNPTVGPTSDAQLAVVHRDCHAVTTMPGWDFAAHRGPYALWVRRVPDGANAMRESR